MGLRYTHLLLFILSSQFCRRTNALNRAIESNNFLDYVNLIIKQLDLFKTTDLKTLVNVSNLTAISDLINFDNPFTNDKSTNTIEKRDSFVYIIDVLKNINNKLLYKYINGNSDIVFKPDYQKKIFEDLGRQLQDEGRKVKTKKLLMKVLLGLKVLSVGLVLPLVLGIALFASWKGVTISLMALLLAGIISLKNIVSGKHDAPQHVVVAPAPSHHQHWWRKTEGPEVISWDSSHELAYSGHR